MINVNSVCEQFLRHAPLKLWAEQLPKQLENRFSQYLHGDLEKWQQAVEALPSATPSTINLNNSRITIGTIEDITENARNNLEFELRKIHPWRKGPFEIFGIHIDTEWRSDWKWDRVRPYLQPLKDRLVLDVGCGNGYYCLRMVGEGAKFVVGIDPTQPYIMQFEAIQKYVKAPNVALLPLAMEDLHKDMQAFDTVFSMGVIYHRRSPIDHLLELKSCLRKGGELVLESLVIEGGVNSILMPERRYAQMRNVWFIPSCAAMELWLMRSGFENIRCVDVSNTSTDEQRVTSWMHYESLSDFLDPNDSNRTKEGYPAPVRAVFVATKP